MSKFDEIMSNYDKIIEENPIPPVQPDYSALDAMKGADISAAIQQLYPDQAEEIMSTLTQYQPQAAQAAPEDPNAPLAPAGQTSSANPVATTSAATPERPTNVTQPTNPQVAR